MGRGWLQGHERPIRGATGTFASLANRNFRLYFTGQAFSFSGTWIQRIAQAWLVLELTDSGTVVGAVAAAQFLPLLLIAPYGGVIADRLNKRTVLYWSQGLSAVAAAALGLLVLTNYVEVWMVFAVSLAMGIAASIDNPTRQSLVMDLVGPELVTNAVTLHSTLVNATRVIGPALAGGLILSVGIGWCFLVNAVSFVALAVAVKMMTLPNERREHGSSTDSQPRSLRAGFGYSFRTREIAVVLALIAVAGAFAYEYQVVLPLLARFTFGSDAGGFAAMSTAMGSGAVAGGLYAASRIGANGSLLWFAGGLFGLLQLLTAFAPTFEVMLLSLASVGAAGVVFISLGNSLLQLTATQEMRGRVMGLYTVAFFGVTPIGAPLMGWIGENLGPRWALGAGGAAVVVATVGTWRFKRLFAPIDIRSGNELGGPTAKI